MSASADGEPFAWHLHQHLLSWKSAGIEWLPRVSPSLSQPIETPPPIPQESQPVLFDTPPPVRSLEDRCLLLNELRGRVAACTRCTELAATRTQTVFGVGAMSPELCFVGEAPGADEDAKGEPFVGAAGKLLDKIITACGMKREEVYICNILRCRPPGNRQPLPDEAANCREWLEGTLELVQPKFLCALGAVAAQNLLQTTRSIGQLRGQFQDYRGIPVLCTYHPAYLLRSPDKKKDVWEDMKKLLVRMGRPIPPVSTGAG